MKVRDPWPSRRTRRAFWNWGIHFGCVQARVASRLARCSRCTWGATPCTSRPAVPSAARGRWRLGTPGVVSPAGLAADQIRRGAPRQVVKERAVQPSMRLPRPRRAKQKAKGPDPCGVRASGERWAGVCLHHPRSRTCALIRTTIGPPRVGRSLVRKGAGEQLFAIDEDGARKRPMARVAGHARCVVRCRFHDVSLDGWVACNRARERTIKILHKRCQGGAQSVHRNVAK